MIEILLGTLTFISNSILAFLVYFRNTKSATNKLFFLLAYVINVYLITNYFSLHPPSPTPESQLRWIRIVMFVTSFIGPILVLLVHTFPHDKIRLSKKKIFALSLLCVTSASAALSPYLFTRLDFINNQPVPQPGPAIPIFFLDFVGLFIVSFMLLIYKYRKATGIEKMQHFYFLTGIIVTFSLMALTTVVFVVILQFSGLVFLGPNTTLFLIAFLAYSIIKHRFLDLHLVIARTVAYTLVVITIAGLYSFFMIYVGTRLFQNQISHEQNIYYGLIALLVTLTFIPMKKGFEKLTDKIFFKGSLTSHEILRDISQATNSSIEIATLAKTILDKTTEEIRITRGAIIILSQKEKHELAYLFKKDYDEELLFEPKDIEMFIKMKGTLVFDEIGEGEQKELLRKYKSSIVSPLIVHGEHIGFMLFGEKATGDIYSDEDISMIEIITPEAAIAMQNSIAYDQIKKFNETLQDEVNKATADLADANEKLKALDKLKDEFVSLASHELRTPMTAIKSYLWLFLQYNKAQLDGKEKLYIERAYSATDRLITLVNDMLNVSRIESGRMNLLFKSVDLVQLTKEVFDELAPTAQKQGVLLHLDENTETLPHVFADPNKIREVFINLIGNSLKFTDTSGKVVVKLTKENDMITVHITDTGKGIKKEDLPKLFQKFGIVGNNYLQKQNSQGTGLGLYISKSIINLHGGQIWVDSDGENKGTTFSFTLKIDDGKQQELESGTMPMNDSLHAIPAIATSA